MPSDRDKPELVRRRPDALSSTVHHVSISASAGPIPHPEILAAYDQIVSGAAQRILAQFEQQSAHRQQLETMKAEARIEARRRGQWCAFLIVLVAAFLTGYGFLVTESAWGSSTIFLSTITGLVSAFVWSKKKDKGRRRKRSPTRAETRPDTDTEASESPAG